ncbi:MAG: VWA domain-containing protein [Terriglobales bacterium]
MAIDARIARFGRILLSLALLPALLAAQEGETETFRVESSLVTVPVEVRDSAGRPVRNLRLEDFRIFQNGEEQKLLSLDGVGADTLPVVASPPSVDARPAKSASAPTPFPATVTRLPVQHVILVFDQVNTEVSDQERGKAQFLKALKKFSRPDLALTLFVANNAGPRLAWGPRLGTEGLAAAIAAIPARPPVTYESGKDLLRAKDAIAVAMASPHSVRTLDKAYQQAAIRTTLAAFRQIAGAYREIKGKKTLLWATAGFPFSFLSDKKTGAGGLSQREFDLAFEALNDAQIAVYPVDIRGLNIVGLPTADLPSTELGVRRPEVLMDVIATPHRESIATMEQIAEVTGGRAFVNRNELAAVLEQVASDGEHYYLLAYKLNRNGLKPGFQKLTVKTTRKTGSVRARSGFYVAGPN